jgi:hypothetical protein
MSSTNEAPLQENISCYDALPRFDTFLGNIERAYGSQAYMLGGIVTAALNAESTVIDKASESVIAYPEQMDQNTVPRVYRPNGTRSDVDVLVKKVLTADEEKLIKNVGMSSVNNMLEVSVHSLRPRKRVTPRRHVTGIGEFTSERTVDEFGVMRYELFPLERIVEPESYRPWHLECNGQRFPILHPAGHMLAYAMRSSSGVRAKDANKYQHMRQQVMDNFEAEIVDGPFKAWLAFSNDIQEVLMQGRHANVGKQRHTNQLDLALLQARGRCLRKVESSEKVVKLGQGVLRPVLDRIIHAA